MNLRLRDRMNDWQLLRDRFCPLKVGYVGGRRHSDGIRFNGLREIREIAIGS